ncbi:Chain length determinant protein [Pedobacter westerhofensis]|uniref:Chain length determinant protein n=1 Tax=Pedobacter westerhofensis TaxID=425512 RepID=A0A521C9K9_9SPHI|nr:Wzz/FepE/Etk N-terminal domain-containing protein [Pedobacter westerhofensis]SMO56086.1 Chain length determinant protein [Pedobacter westerhofensis]
MSTENPEKLNEVSFKDLIISLRDLIRYLRTKWVVILIYLLAGGVLGLIYSIRSKPSYLANCTFVLEEESGGGGGGLASLSGLASIVGLDIGGGGGGVFQGDNLLELYKSRMMITKTLLSSYLIDGKNQLLVDRYVRYNRFRENQWSDDPKLKNVDFIAGKNGGFSRIQDSLLTEFTKDINKRNLVVIKPDKKLNIIKVQLTAPDEQFAKGFNDKIVKNVSDFYVQTKTKKSTYNLGIIQHQTDSVRRMLNGAISGVAAATDVNPNINPSRLVLKVPSQRRQVDVQANTAILTELVKNLELSKVSLRKETPLIQIIDEPVYPLPVKKNGKVFSFILGAILAGLLGVIVLTTKRALKSVLA